MTPTPTQLRLHEERKARLPRLGMGSKAPLRFVMHEVKSVKRTKRERRSLPSIAHVPQNTASYNRPHSSPYREILAQVADGHGITQAVLCGSSRSYSVVRARHEACYRLRHERGMSFPQIARYVGLSDHTSALAGVRRHASRIGDGEVTHG